MYNPLYNSLGLLFFIPIISYSIKGLIALIVFFNGIICHGSNYIEYEYSKEITLYDIVCNVIMGIYILITVKRNLLLIAFVVAIAVFCFIINRIRYNSSPILHVLGIQLPLAIGLYNY